MYLYHGKRLKYHFGSKHCVFSSRNLIQKITNFARHFFFYKISYVVFVGKNSETCGKIKIIKKCVSLSPLSRCCRYGKDLCKPEQKIVAIFKLSKTNKNTEGVVVVVVEVVVEVEVVVNVVV
jgi:hypothetical protein